MIEWALKPVIRKIISRFSETAVKLQTEFFKDADWLILIDYEQFLKPFLHATLVTESPIHIISEIISFINYLLEHYEASFNKYVQNEFFFGKIILE